MILVLDVDGVVVTGHPEGGRWDRHLARDLGIEPARLQERFFKPHFQEIVVGKADLYETLARVWPEIECAVSARTFVDYWFAADSRIDLEVLELVASWRQSIGPAYLATNQEHHRARHLWKTLELSRHFDGMIYSANLGVRKPDPRFFQRAQTQFDAIEPGEILFADDFAVNVDAAAALGWRARLYDGIDTLRQEVDAAATSR